jgi:hypothetical protein
MGRLPVPQRGGTIAELRPFLNVASDSDFILIATWLVGALHPTGPYPVLVLHGEQGSGKSTTARMLKALIDPSVGPLRAAPGTEQDLFITASRNAVLVFDNLSQVPGWLSDALCRLATGGGTGRRRLYSNDEEHVLTAMRPVILTSIGEVVTQGDLLDRALICDLPAISTTSRQAESTLWPAFEVARPRILGALLDGLVGSLNRGPATKLSALPRMADFTIRGAAAATGLNEWTGAAFVQALEANREASHDIVLEATPITTALEKLFTKRSAWEGTAAELLRDLSVTAAEEERRSAGWPKDTTRLSALLRRITPQLRTIGIEVTFARGARRRTITLRHAKAAVVASSASSASSPAALPPAIEGSGQQVAKRARVQQHINHHPRQPAQLADALPT